EWTTRGVAPDAVPTTTRPTQLAAARNAPIAPSPRAICGEYLWLQTTQNASKWQRFAVIRAALTTSRERRKSRGMRLRGTNGTIVLRLHRRIARLPKVWD